nr:carbonic anhydrase family protein [Bifidobacterium bifidum]
MLAVVALVSFNYSFAAEGNQFDWSYAQQTAPAQWSKIKSEYQACEGRNQAPINIDQTISAKLPALKLNYSSKADTII